jgi:hypothetical protein
MTAKERIRKALYGARGPLCDDCLPGEAILRRRQQANAECRLWREGEVNRGRGTCALCGGVKLVNWSLAPTTRAANMSVRASGLVPATGDFQPQSTAQPLPTRKASPGTAPWPPAEAAIRCFGDYAFARVCEIQPERDRAGQVRSFTPHEHSPNSRSLPLHVDGSGPFCRFRIPSDLPLEGVYLLVVRDIVRYVGECDDLSSGGRVCASRCSVSSSAWRAISSHVPSITCCSIIGSPLLSMISRLRLFVLGCQISDGRRAATRRHGDTEGTRRLGPSPAWDEMNRRHVDQAAPAHPQRFASQCVDLRVSVSPC